MIDFSAHRFHPVVRLPEQFDVLDLTGRSGVAPMRTSEFSIGRYDEDRRGVYTQALFEGSRTIHMGIDIGAPAGTLIYAPHAGRIWCTGCNTAAGDYGPTLITVHELDDQRLWILYGHLGREVLARWSPGMEFVAGARLAEIGAETENGGWPPHLHLQLSLIEPDGCDLPGVVSGSERESALIKFPDPRLILGPIY